VLHITYEVPIEASSQPVTYVVKMLQESGKQSRQGIRALKAGSCVVQAVRSEVVAADAAFLQKEVERLTGELVEARGGAAETIALRAELAAASAAGSHLAEELAAAESAVRATQVPKLETLD